jgi:pimeloyl-ACP methyl ester carboxylesterase
MTLVDTIQGMPVRHEVLADGAVLRYREAGSKAPDAPVLVLLHGIGSGSASWVRQLLAADGGVQRVLAWDAPGYADSSAVLADAPSSADYAARFWLWMDALKVDTLHLVGHSLGCIMAAGAAHAQPARVQRLTLLAPAQGYGTGTPAQRAKMCEDRIGMLTRLGAAGMATQRAPALLTPSASSEDIALATLMMASLNNAGYAKATHLLANAVIANDLAGTTCPITVACGDADTITPPAACKSLADKLHAPYVDLPGAGHLCAVQAWPQVNQLLKLG